MEKLILLNYRNYSNKLYSKPPTSIYEYPSYIYQESKCNFNEGDKINTIYTAGRQSNSYDGSANYCIITEHDDDQVISRWFITNQIKNRGGQWQLTLKRDTISDYYDDFINSIANIKRGIVSTSNKLIYNNEGFELNQIKKSEELLKDETGCSWIVGYYTEQSSGTDTFPLTASTNISQPVTVSFDDTKETFLSKYLTIRMPYNFKIHDADGNITGYESSAKIKLEYLQSIGTINLGYSNTFYLTDMIQHQIIDSSVKSAPLLKQTLDISGLNRNTIATYANQLVNSDIASVVSQYNNKYIKFSDNSIYYCKFNIGTIEQSRLLTASDQLYTYLKGSLSSYFDSVQATVMYTQTAYQLTLSEYVDGSYNVAIPANQNILNDAPYHMFCMPYGKCEIYLNGIKTITNADINISIAQALNTKYGETFIKDVQLLPYCPVRDWINTDGSITIPSVENNYTPITRSTDTVGYILFPTRSSFTFNIKKQLTVSDVKLENECDLYRLSSPNGNGGFDFNLAKNGGLEFINVDCTYMPFNPFIHLSPNFSNMYGDDFNDFRGLICGGDFSLPKTTSAWETYQLNNKNYQSIFDRGIQNMEINQDIQKISNALNIATSTISGASIGSGGGKFIGGPAGMAAGAAIGSAVGLTTSVLDYHLNNKLMEEQKSYTKDMFTLQNGNIKAQAQGISKTIAFNINNKVFPVLEYYTCSDNERDQVKDYLKYRGYTLNIIDKISNYNGYIEGIIIRTDIFDTSISNDINIQLNGGIYLNEF